MPTIDDELIQNAKAVFNSEVIINSANDLKIKDGTSFGGDDVKIFEIDFNRFSQDEYPQATLTSEEVISFENSDFVYLTNMVNEGDKQQFLKSDTQTAERTQLNDTIVSSMYLTLSSNTLSLGIQQLQIDFSNYATKTDLENKQSTLYRHTVLISEPTNKTAYLTFTASSVNNTPINSIQNLITVFGNTSISCSGIYRDGDPANEQSLLMINVGTSISNTTISSATIANSAITDFSNAPFTDTFGSTGFTITDYVTAM